MGQTSKTSAYIPPPVCVVHIVDDDDDDCDDDDDAADDAPERMSPRLCHRPGPLFLRPPSLSSGQVSIVSSFSC